MPARTPKGIHVELTQQDIDRLRHYAGGKQAFNIGEETRSLERAGFHKFEPLSNATLATATDRGSQIVEDWNTARKVTATCRTGLHPGRTGTMSPVNSELTDEEMAPTSFI